jgi:hypothetical protein
MDGDAQIEDCEEAFGVTLVIDEDGYEKTFPSLKTSFFLAPRT